MPRYINVKGHGVLRFPDGMSDDDIQKVLAEQFPKPEPGVLGTLANSAISAFASGASRATLPDPANSNIEAKSPQQRDRVPDLTPGSADLSASEFWQRIAADHPLPPSAQGNVVDNPGLLANPKFYAQGIGGLVGGLPYMLESGLDRGKQIQDETGSRVKGSLVGLGETALNTVPFGEGLGRLARAGLFGAASGAAPVAEAAARGEDLTPAIKEALTAAVPGAIFGGLLPGGNKRRGLGATPEADFENRLRGLGDSEPPADAAPVAQGRGLGMPSPEELAGITERAAETRTLDAQMERRLRTEEGLPPDQTAPEPVRASEQPIDPDAAEALRREVQASQRGAPSEFDKSMTDKSTPDPFAPPAEAPAKPLEQKLKEPMYREALMSMRRETGWAEVGGRGVQNDQGYNVGRTSWVPRAPWWKDRPKGLNEGQVKDAIAKALAGEKLSKRETDMIDYMTAYVDEVSKTPPSTHDINGEIPGFNDPYYHGSPHRFDEFKMEAIGTGEGNQTFGHGLYFAQSKDVAKSYRPHSLEVTLAKTPTDPEAAVAAMRILKQEHGDFAMAKESADSAVGDYHVAAGLHKQPRYEALAERMRAARALLDDESMFNVQRNQGALYHVDIPKEATDRMLDLDAPLRDQPSVVKRALWEHLKDYSGDPAAKEPYGAIGLERMWRRFRADYGAGGAVEDVGREIYSLLSDNLGSPETASNYLLKRGIPGNKYFDAGSRATGSGTRNVVLFDDSLVKIQKLEQPRRAYKGQAVEGPEGRQIEFTFETRKESTPTQVDNGVKIIQNLMGRLTRTGGGRVLALGLTKDFTDTGSAVLIGREVRTPDDLAVAGQVWRDPRVETLRVVYVKSGKVVHQAGMSSRLPAAIHFNIGKMHQLMRESMRMTGADGYYMQHNHPGGDPNPSRADQLMTTAAKNAVPGFLGHVVIDNQSYTVIEKNGQTRRVEDKNLGGYNTKTNPRVNHPLLERELGGYEDLAHMAKWLGKQKDRTTLVAVDTRMQVRAIVDIPTDALKLVNGKPAATAIAYLRRLGRNSGASFVHAITEFAPELQPFVESGHLGLVSDIRSTLGDAHSFDMNYRRIGGGLGREKDGAQFQDEPMSGMRENQTDETAPRPERTQAGGGDYSNKQFGNLSDAELSTLTSTMKNVEGAISGQRRGTRTWSDTEAAALRLVQQKFGVTLDGLISRKQGSTANAEQLEAYGMVLSKAAQEVTEAMQTAVRSGADQDLVALGAAREKLGVLIAPAMGYKTEAGRALNILRKASQDWRSAQKLVEALPEGGIEVMRQYAKDLRKAGNLDQVIALTRETYKPTFGDKFNEYWINGLLSGPTTHVVNISSNGLFQALELVAESVASLGSKHVHQRALAARVGGMVHGIGHGLANAKKAFATEEPQLNPVSKLELDKRRSIGGKLGRIVRIPGRALMAEDEYFKALAYHGELGSLAMEEAIGSGKPVREEFDRIMGDVQNRPDLIERAKLAADRATFQDKLGPFMQSVSNLRYRGGPGSWFLQKIIPFVRTPVNILKRAVEYSPGALTLREARDAISSGGKDRAMAVSRMMVGSGIMLGAMGLAANGTLSGNGPDNPQERALLMRQGWQPYSVRVGDKWVRYNRFDPIGTVLGVAADMYDIGAAGSAGDWDKVGSLAMTSIALNLGDKTFLRGISDFSQAYTDPKRYFQRWASGMAASLIPNAAAQLARGTDPFMREARTTVDQILAKLPGARDRLATKLDIAGEPIRQESDFPGNPLQQTPVKDDALAGALLKLGLNKSLPDRQLIIGGQHIELNDHDYQGFAAYVQQARWRTLTPLANSPQFQALMKQNPQAAADALDKQWDRIGKDARRQWLSMNPGALIGASRKQATGSNYTRYTENAQ